MFTAILYFSGYYLMPAYNLVIFFRDKTMNHVKHTLIENKDEFLLKYCGICHWLNARNNWK